MAERVLIRLENEGEMRMKAVVQRVRRADLYVEGAYRGGIGKGLVVLIGVGRGDSEAEGLSLAEKIVSLRIFPESDGKMAMSVKDVNGGVIIVSQFTLYANCGRGNRPDFSAAAPGPEARGPYEAAAKAVEDSLGPGNFLSGDFGKEMLLEIHNNGPVTIILNTDKESLL